MKNIKVLVLTVTLSLVLVACGDRTVLTEPVSLTPQGIPSIRLDYACTSYETPGHMFVNCTYFDPNQGIDTTNLGNSPECGSYWCGTADDCIRNPRGCVAEFGGGLIIPTIDEQIITTYTGQGTPSTGCPGGATWCLHDMTPAQKALLDSAKTYMKTTFANASDSTFCNDLLEYSLQNSWRVRAATNYPSWLGDNHSMNTVAGLIHIDDDIWALAASDPSYRKSLIAGYFHEILHAKGQTHPGETAPPYTVGNFARLNFDGTNACIANY